MALNLINTICNDNNEMKKDVFDTAIIAMQARLNFWDGVLEAIKSKKLINVYGNTNYKRKFNIGYTNINLKRHVHFQ
mgnify:CR=1 FL=1